MPAFSVPCQHGHPGSFAYVTCVKLGLIVFHHLHLPVMNLILYCVITILYVTFKYTEQYVPPHISLESHLRCLHVLEAEFVLFLIYIIQHGTCL